ncbi:MAG: ribonuclease HII [Candidatus Moranbacteria bacterium]|nr:ribonuclease HII [Candidatus Moranbacteria bacterium]
MKKSTFELENKLLNDGYDFIIGIDEAGRGPLAGPVVAAATITRNFQFPNLNFQKNVKCQMSNVKMFDLIRDSKTLSAKQREKLFDFIQEHFYVGIGICDHRTIDKVNILQASFLAMKAALSDLKSKIKNQKSKLQFKNQKEILDTRYKIPDTKYIVLVDGKHKIPNFSHKQKNIVSGDKLVKSISAASIAAKVTRDRIMLKMHKKYPHYGFRLKKHGPCRIHRKSFKPVEKLVKAKK